LAHISTGDLLRDEIKRETEIGRFAAGIMKEGKLVPDQLVADLVRARLQQPDCEQGFILDGYPRTIAQAELLNSALASLGRKLDKVIYLSAPEELLIQRLTARMNCKSCGVTYNKQFAKPKKEGVCDHCGGELVQRPDDSLETAQKRLQVFHDQTAPLIEYYTKAGLLLEIPQLDKDVTVVRLFKELEA
ncbi:MAG: adenylate kinase family protein, partial [Victivallaceae bacterium]